MKCPICPRAAALVFVSREIHLLLFDRADQPLGIAVLLWITLRRHADLDMVLPPVSRCNPPRRIAPPGRCDEWSGHGRPGPGAMQSESVLDRARVRGGVRSPHSTFSPVDLLSYPKKLAVSFKVFAVYLRLRYIAIFLESFSSFAISLALAMISALLYLWY